METKHEITMVTDLSRCIIKIRTKIYPETHGLKIKFVILAQDNKMKHSNAFSNCNLLKNKLIHSGLMITQS